jgi:UDP-N-acetyl-D-glucosamine/UDP-N-acetyl-D-galactosamine dehydrogenase
MILASRRINDNMGLYVVGQVVKLMLRKQIQVMNSKVLILGLTFKENCPDVRNTKVVDIVKEFETYGAVVDVYDPWVDKDESREVYGIEPVDVCVAGSYDAVVLCVGHEEFKEKGVAWVASLGKEISVLYDVKNLLPVGLIDGRL